LPDATNFFAKIQKSKVSECFPNIFSDFLRFAIFRETTVPEKMPLTKIFLSKDLTKGILSTVPEKMLLFLL